MSCSVSIKVGDSEENYTVADIRGCRVVYGPVPLTEVESLCYGFSEEARVDFELAAKLGASLVIGEPADLLTLSRNKLPENTNYVTEAQEAALLGLDIAVVGWLRSGERGLSANALCKRIFGYPYRAGVDHPLDAADKERCDKFMTATGTRHLLDQMREVSPEWDAAVQAWDAPC